LVDPLADPLATSLADPLATSLADHKAASLADHKAAVVASDTEVEVFEMEEEVIRLILCSPLLRSFIFLYFIYYICNFKIKPSVSNY
jgi:hypothetical protein